MQRNAKKLAVLVMTAAIAMFIAAAIASADGPSLGKGNALHGEYYFTGAGPCLVAPGGFNGALQPSIEGVYFMSNTTWEGVYTFNRDGTGKISGLFRVVEQYGPGIGAPPDAGLATIGWEFTYSVAKSGRITFTVTKGTYLAEWLYGPNADTKLYVYHEAPYYGTVSPDHKSISVSWGVPLEETVTADPDNDIDTGVRALCNVVQTGFWCNGPCPEPVYSTP